MVIFLLGAFGNMNLTWSNLFCILHCSARERPAKPSIPQAVRHDQGGCVLPARRDFDKLLWRHGAGTEFRNCSR